MLPIQPASDLVDGHPHTELITYPGYGVFHPTSNNRTRLLINGDDAFHTIIEEIEKAQHSIAMWIVIARKSIVAARNIRKGEPFTEENLTAKRSGTGLTPMRWDDVVGKKAIKNYSKDDLIDA